MCDKHGDACLSLVEVLDGCVTHCGIRDHGRLVVHHQDAKTQVCHMHAAGLASKALFQVLHPVLDDSHQQAQQSTELSTGPFLVEGCRSPAPFSMIKSSSGEDLCMMSSRQQVWPGRLCKKPMHLSSSRRADACGLQSMPPARLTGDVNALLHGRPGCFATQILCFPASPLAARSCWCDAGHCQRLFPLLSWRRIDLPRSPCYGHVGPLHAPPGTATAPEC